MPRPRFPIPLLLALALLPGAVPHAGAAELPPAHAVVLMYHRFGEAAYPSTSVRLDQFEAQLGHLAEGGYKVWPLAKVVADLAGGRPVPDGVLAITVDDAYASVYAEAYPRLRERGWPFTVFVATDSVDRGQGAPLTWDQMREMAAHGATFANHTASHDHLLRRLPGEDEAAWEARVRADIGRAASRLTAELGASPSLFAYPYGEYDPALAALVRDMGYTAFGQHSGAMGADSDPAALPRFPIAEAFGALDAFRVKVASLPLPVSAVDPTDPVVHGANPPRLVLTVAPGDPLLGRLACFAGGQGPAVLEWRDRTQGRVAVTAAKPLAPGRGRYNCTAPSAALAGRYYWYSHPWIVSGGGPG